MGKTFTLVVHGTFAEQALWWRLGGGGVTTFADRLERELSSRGLSNTVWKPALDAGFDYSTFAWSGRNRHRDRLQGARCLGRNLNLLADKLQATPEEPLTVHFVAHSHGGNVVLEGLRYLKPNVRVGRVALLGTPLVIVRPAFRLARFVFSTILLAVLFLLIIMVAIQFVTLVTTGHFLPTPGVADSSGELTNGHLPWWFYVVAFPAVLTIYGWVFWAFGNLLDVGWRIFCRLGEPLAWMRGASRRLMYGPPVWSLRSILRGGRVVLITSQNDEADLLLQVGAAPGRLYREYVSSRISSLGRVFEIVFLRPFVLGVFLKAIEIFLEVLALGVPVWRALVQDFEVVAHAPGQYYPPDLLIHERWDVRPTELTRSVGHAEAVGTDNRLTRNVTPNSNLRLTLKDVTAELKRQIRLRHSTYYEDGATITHIAEVLTGTVVSEDVASVPPSTLPSPEYWEMFLLANVALGIFYSRTMRFLPDDEDMAFVLGIGSGYIVSVIGLGLGFLVSLAKHEHCSVRPWRWAWISWGIYAASLLLVRWAP